MVCSKKLIFLAACLLVMASGAMGVTIVPSGSTVTFNTNDPPSFSGDANGVTISIENGAAKFVFSAGLDIQAGATVTVTGTNALFLVAATGDITVSADINLNGAGSTEQNGGGAAGPAGGKPGAIKRGVLDYALQGPGSGGTCWTLPYDAGITGTWTCGSGAGYGGAGGMNSQDANDLLPGGAPVLRDIYNGVAYGDPHVYLLMGGSGGGGGKDCSGNGGGGGAIGLKAEAGNITINANITSNGGGTAADMTGVSGKQRYGGGGGSGGSIRIDAGAGTVTLNGSLSANGGAGCNSLWIGDKTDSIHHHGGGGGGGRIAIYSASGSHAGSGTVSVTGGAGGYLYNPPAPPTAYLTFPGGAGGAGTFAQYAGPMAPLAYGPIPAETSPANTNISIFTDLKWQNGGGTSQDVYFETSAGNLGLIKSGSGTFEQVTAAELQTAMGGPLADLTTYQWKVVTNGNTAAAAIWSFTTGNSVAHNPVPADNAYEASYGASVTVSWQSDSSLTATAADVYFGTSSAAVAARTATKYTATTAPFTSAVVSAPDRGVRYYWLVDQKYGALVKASGVFTFRTVAKRVNLKTGVGDPVGSPSIDIDGVAGGATVVVDDANVANYKFTTFSYDSTWDVNATGRRAFAIWSDAGISFDGRLNVSGGTALNTSHKGGAGIAGGYNGGGDQLGTSEDPPWPLVTTDQINGPGHGNPSDIAVTNPGMTEQISIGGSGAGYGGAGGFYSRYLTGFGGAGGLTYGEPQVYAIRGGSGGAGGGTGQSSGGGGGGGAVEFYAKAGNIVLGANAQIKTNGGTIDVSDPCDLTDPMEYPGGGGSGGTVRLIASGNVSVAGLVTANGGDGGDRTAADPCDCGGGGGGGRIAVYAGGTYTNTGTVTATGGAKGTDTNGASNAKSGGDGTVYTTGKTADLLKTVGAAPADKYMSWNASADPNFQKVSWYPALGSTENKLYFGTSQASLALVKTATNANGLRQQEIYSTGVLNAGQKYYWRVDINGVAGPVWVFGTGTCAAVNGDANGDCRVTFVDFALMASQWKVCNLALSSQCGF